MVKSMVSFKRSYFKKIHNGGVGIIRVGGNNFCGYRKQSLFLTIKCKEAGVEMKPFCDYMIRQWTLPSPCIRATKAWIIRWLISRFASRMDIFKCMHYVSAKFWWGESRPGIHMSSRNKIKKNENKGKSQRSLWYCPTYVLVKAIFTASHVN